MGRQRPSSASCWAVGQGGESHAYGSSPSWRYADTMKRWNISSAHIAGAVDVLARGGVVAFPTDTVYGVGADVRQPDAIASLYEIKRRPMCKAIPVLLARAEDLHKVAEGVPNSAWRLVERFWPGALTLVVQSAVSLPSILTAGGSTVAVRMPDHPVARALIDGLGAPLAVTSANISGQPNPVTAEDVVAQLEGRVDLLLDGGPCPGGNPSTVVDVTASPARILRSGLIAADRIQDVLCLADEPGRPTI